MNNFLYPIAVVLVILWAIAFFGFLASGIIHILLVMALIAILVRLIKGRNPH